MFILRVRCLSKNTGEVFYDYVTKKLFDLDSASKKLDAAKLVFFKRLMSDIKEDCTFEISVIHEREELPLFSDNEEFLDFKDSPVVF